MNSLPRSMPAFLVDWAISLAWSWTRSSTARRYMSIRLRDHSLLATGARPSMKAGAPLKPSFGLSAVFRKRNLTAARKSSRRYFSNEATAKPLSPHSTYEDIQNALLETVSLRPNLIPHHSRRSRPRPRHRQPHHRQGRIREQPHPSPPRPL